ncbi:MAG TPA: hypothetical protein VGY56_06715 [Verrucomicrobiae bacterium]|nr:hypothetical protein [Verrucomicrobiae bacterium]
MNTFTPEKDNVRNVCVATPSIPEPKACPLIPNSPVNRHVGHRLRQ